MLNTSDISVGTTFHPKPGKEIMFGRTDVIIEVLGKESFLASTLSFDDMEQPHFANMGSGGTVKLSQIGELIGQISKEELRRLERELGYKTNPEL